MSTTWGPIYEFVGVASISVWRSCTSSQNHNPGLWRSKGWASKGQYLQQTTEWSSSFTVASLKRSTKAPYPVFIREIANLSGRLGQLKPWRKLFLETAKTEITRFLLSVPFNLLNLSDITGQCSVSETTHTVNIVHPVILRIATINWTGTRKSFWNILSENTNASGNVYGTHYAFWAVAFLWYVGRNFRL